MIAQSTTDPNKFVLAIRGTDTYQEMLQDLTAIWLVPWDLGKVGFCFSEIYKTMHIVLRIPIPIPPPGTFAHQVAAVVEHAAAAARPQSAKVKRDISVVVTGHSLGAALGTLYVAQNVNHKLLTNPLICTFGSPLVGDPEFVRNFNRLRITSWRIVNGRPPRFPYNIITVLPPDIFGFGHIKGEYPNKITTDVVPTPVCWHHIKTYQHLLDARQPLFHDCSYSLARRSRRLPLKPIPHQ
jgi:Lipase (class 3)